MSRTRKLIIAFWIFIVCMLLWQFYTYDQSLTQASVEHPTQEHFWFTNSVATAAAPPPKNGPDIQQVNIVTRNNTPGPGSFTCLVTLKNKGNAKAVGIQIMVRPYRGATNYDEDGGAQKVVVLSDDDPLSKYGQWVAFPDLAPGESSTQSVVFTGQSYTRVIPPKNPNPEIIFQTEKAKSPAPPGAAN